jgi:hypothetical protein
MTRSQNMLHRSYPMRTILKLTTKSKVLCHSQAATLGTYHGNKCSRIPTLCHGNIYRSTYLLWPSDCLYYSPRQQSCLKSTARPIITWQSESLHYWAPHEMLREWKCLTAQILHLDLHTGAVKRVHWTSAFGFTTEKHKMEAMLKMWDSTRDKGALLMTRD